MRYIAAVLGAVLIFALTFILTTPALLMIFGERVMIDVSVGSFGTNNPIGFLLAIAAAAATYTETLRHYKKRDERKSQESIE